MAKVEVEIESTSVLNAQGQSVEGLMVTCGDCDHTVEVEIGQDNLEVAERRGLCKLRASCIMKERNTYVKVK